MDTAFAQAYLEVLAAQLDGGSLWSYAYGPTPPGWEPDGPYGLAGGETPGGDNTITPPPYCSLRAPPSARVVEEIFLARARTPSPAGDPPALVPFSCLPALPPVEDTNSAAHANSASLTTPPSPSLRPLSLPPVTPPYPPKMAMSESPASLTLTLRDAAISCVCPPGTKREVKDLFKAVTKDKGVTWTHRLCAPWATKATTGEGEVTTAGEHGPLSGLLGPNPTELMIWKLERFQKKFICDGCVCASRPFKDYEMCRRCCAWQHKECMLYGEKGDVGGPVCNHCYMEFLVNDDEIRAWQRHRLKEAVQHAFMFLTDLETSHEVWRRKYCMEFLTRFMGKNMGLFVKQVYYNRRAEYVAQQQGIYDAENLPAATNIEGSMEIDGEESADQKEEVVSIASTVSSDNIRVVAPGSKRAKRSGREIAKPPRKRVRKSSPVDTNGKRRIHRKKTETESTASTGQTPPAVSKGRRKAQLEGSQAPRKSVRMSEVMAPRVYTQDDDDDEEDGEDEEEAEVGKAGENEEDENEGEDALMGTEFTRSFYDTKAVQAQIHALLNETSPPLPPSHEQKPCCSCSGLTRNGDEMDCFTCSNCGNLQHMDCAEQDRDDAHPVCNNCSKPDASSQIPDELSIAASVTADNSLDDAMLNDIHVLSSTFLWNEYTSLPSPNDEGGEAATPSKTPPPDWLDECKARLTSMLAAVGPLRIAILLEPVLKASPRQADQIQQSLTDLALWLTRTGPWRGKGAELGLLSEILGLERKGRYWQGGGL